LTVTGISMDGEISKINATSLKPIQVGDVFLSVGGESTKAGMVAQFKKAISATCHLVRVLEFEAEVVKTSPDEPLRLDAVERGEKLFVKKFSTDEGPIVRYNQSKYRRPIARGDFILAVNEKSVVSEMVAEIRESSKLILRIKRGAGA